MSRYDGRRYDDGRPSYSASTYRPGERSSRQTSPPYDSRAPASHGPDGADRRPGDSSWNGPPRYQPSARCPSRYSRNSPPPQRSDQSYGNARPPYSGRPRSRIEARDDPVRGSRPYNNDSGPRSRFPAENNYRPRNYSRSPPRATNLSSNHTPLGSRRTSPHRQGDRSVPDVVRPDPRTPRVDSTVSRTDARDQFRGNAGSSSAYPPTTPSELKLRPFDTPEVARGDRDPMAPNPARAGMIDAPSGPRGQHAHPTYYQTPHGAQDRRDTHQAPLNLRTESMPERPPAERGQPRRSFGDVTPQTPRGPKGYDRHDQFRAPYRANTDGSQRVAPHEKYLANMYTLTEGGRKPPSLLDPTQEKRMTQLEEDQRKLTDALIAKQATLRAAMYEWEKAEGDVARESFKVEMANQQLARIAGSETGSISGAAY